MGKITRFTKLDRNQPRLLNCAMDKLPGAT